MYTGCADKLYGFDTNGLAGSDMSSAEIGRVQVLTRFPATTRHPVTSASLFSRYLYNLFVISAHERRLLAATFDRRGCEDLVDFVDYFTGKNVSRGSKNLGNSS